ncbi:ABC transporter permease [Paenibacillus albiflavus]|uniref:Transport permease protein n=1 Tax=Paenibacillus albiflavus TaxID=2545760 RepID=A0A4R4E4F5_9BACL|nr:ABC transporter permease [Paenibacillus albiflavus]TCZ73590.1 ABC transporter permease [Paenibacillus albiflavus]
MKAYLNLTLAQLKLFIRNRQTLGFSLLFPIFFMFVFGYLFNSNNSISLDAAVIDQDRTEASKRLMDEFERSGILHITKYENEDAALIALKNNEINLVLVIPADYNDELKQFTEKVVQNHNQSSISTAPDVQAAHIRMYYDQSNVATAGIAKTTVAAIVDGISKQIVHFQPAITIDEQGIQSLNLAYIDFIIPGIVAMMIMSNNLNMVAGQIASWRERGVLRRMQSTTLRASTFIAAQISARLILSSVQTFILLLIGHFVFDVQVRGSWLVLLLFVILGTLAFMSIGFIVASLAKTPESANPIAGLISFPMMFLGGVFFPIKNTPEFLQPVVHALPISHLSTALRQVMNTGADLIALSTEAMVLGCWMIAAFALASIIFKWE